MGPGIGLGGAGSVFPGQQCLGSAGRQGVGLRRRAREEGWRGQRRAGGVSALLMASVHATDASRVFKVHLRRLDGAVKPVGSGAVLL